MTIKYFSTPTCAPCKTFAPIVDRVMNEVQIPYQKINASTSEMAAYYGVTSVPTIIIERGGQIIKRYTGVMTYSQLLSFVTN